MIFTILRRCLELTWYGLIVDYFTINTCGFANNCALFIISGSYLGKVVLVEYWKVFQWIEILLIKSY